MSILSSSYNTGAQFRITAEGDASNAGDLANVYEYYMGTGTGVSGADVLDDLVDIFTALYVLISAFTNAVAVWRGIRVTELDGSNATGLLPFVGGDITGQLTNDPIPTGVALLMSFPTGIKRVVPRKFFGVLDTSLLGASGNFGSAPTTAMTNTAAFLVTPQVETQTWYYSHKVKGVGPTVFPDSAVISLVPAYQRRRKLNVGS